ncbi:MAG: DnaD domain protein [Oscillospiraceae bacterium]
MAEDLLAEPKKLNRVVIKEELVALTGDFKLAIILNQMIYWSERRLDADKFISEEIERLKRQSATSDNTGPLQPAHGWIYKKAEELVTETMIGSSAKTMLSYLNTLVEKGWLQKRKNPRYDFDRTYQYRVDLIKIQTDLLSLGYSLEGYDLGITNLQNVNTNLQKVNSIKSGFVNNKPLETPESPYLPFENTYCKNVNTNLQNVRAIPETTNLEEEKEEEEGLQQDFENNKQEYEHHIQTDSTNKNPNSESSNNKQDSQKEISEFASYTGTEMTGKASRDTYIKWRYDWGFSHEMIMLAGQLMTQLAKAPNLSYVDRILSDWMNRHIRSVPEATQAIESYRSRNHDNTSSLPITKKSRKTNMCETTGREYEYYVPPDVQEELC